MCRNSVTTREFKRYLGNGAHKRYPEDDSLNSKFVKRATVKRLLRTTKSEIPSILVQIMLLTIDTRDNTRQNLLRLPCCRRLQTALSIEMRRSNFIACYYIRSALIPSLSVFRALSLLSLSLYLYLPVALFAVPLPADFIRNVMNTIMCATLVTNAVKPIMLITEIKFVGYIALSHVRDGSRHFEGIEWLV